MKAKLILRQWKRLRMQDLPFPHIVQPPTLPVSVYFWTDNMEMPLAQIEIFGGRLLHRDSRILVFGERR